MTDVVLRQSYLACRALTWRAAKNFRYAFLTLSRDRYDAMCALYTFMRVADDCSDDEAQSLPARRAAVRNWGNALSAGLAGAPSGPLMPAICDMIQRFQVPEQYLRDVLTGVARDLDPVALQTQAELDDYCYHVAGAVGLCCLHLWGFHDPAAIPLGIECGLAVQLTNILRDVGEDFALGRIYLPAEDLARFGYTTEDLARQTCDDRFRALMKHQADRAQAAYDHSAALLPLVDPGGRPILRVIRDIYGGLLREIVRRDYDVFRKKVRLPLRQKLSALVCGWWRGARLP
jgi:phytoene synthase